MLREGFDWTEWSGRRKERGKEEFETGHWIFVGREKTGGGFSGEGDGPYRVVEGCWWIRDS